MKLKHIKTLIIIVAILSATLPSAITSVSAAVPNTLVNGDFEDGTLTPWTTDTTYPSAVRTHSFYIYSGSYGLSLYRYISGTFYPSFVEQDVSIDTSVIDSISFYMKSWRPVKVTISYADGSSPYEITYNANYAWQLKTITVTDLGQEKTISKVRLERLGASASSTAIDEIQINYKKYSNLVNGDFEDGTLSPWITDTTYPSAVRTHSFYIHSGSYGLSLYRYISGTFYPSFVEQNLAINVNDVQDISFWMKSWNSVKLTLSYADGTTPFTITYTANYAWEQKTIANTELVAGKQISKLRLERIGSGASSTAIDDIVINDQPPQVISVNINNPSTWSYDEEFGMSVFVGVDQGTIAIGNGFIERETDDGSWTEVTNAFTPIQGWNDITVPADGWIGFQNYRAKVMVNNEWHTSAIHQIRMVGPPRVGIIFHSYGVTSVYEGEGVNLLVDLIGNGITNEELSNGRIQKYDPILLEWTTIDGGIFTPNMNSLFGKHETIIGVPGDTANYRVVLDQNGYGEIVSSTLIIEIKEHYFYLSGQEFTMRSSDLGTIRVDDTGVIFEKNTLDYSQAKATMTDYSGNAISVRTTLSYQALFNQLSSPTLQVSYPNAGLFFYITLGTDRIDAGRSNGYNTNYRAISSSTWYDLKIDIFHGGTLVETNLWDVRISYKMSSASSWTLLYSEKTSVSLNEAPELILGTKTLNQISGTSGIDSFVYTNTSIVEINDRDYDGVNDVDEYQFNNIGILVDVNNPDTDNDGLPDGLELNSDADFRKLPILSVMGTSSSNIIQNIGYSVDDISYYSNPTEWDTDKDSLSDLDERRMASNPNMKDTDRDGINDNMDWEVNIVDTAAPSFVDISGRTFSYSEQDGSVTSFTVPTITGEETVFYSTQIGNAIYVAFMVIDNSGVDDIHFWTTGLDCPVFCQNGNWYQSGGNYPSTYVVVVDKFEKMIIEDYTAHIQVYDKNGYETDIISVPIPSQFTSIVKTASDVIMSSVDWFINQILSVGQWVVDQGQHAIDTVNEWIDDIAGSTISSIMNQINNSPVGKVINDLSQTIEMIASDFIDIGVKDLRLASELLPQGSGIRNSLLGLSASLASLSVNQQSLKFDLDYTRSKIPFPDDQVGERANYAYQWYDDPANNIIKIESIEDIDAVVDELGRMDSVMIIPYYESGDDMLAQKDYANVIPETMYYQEKFEAEFPNQQSAVISVSNAHAELLMEKVNARSIFVNAHGLKYEVKIGPGENDVETRYKVEFNEKVGVVGGIVSQEQVAAAIETNSILAPVEGRGDIKFVFTSLCDSDRLVETLRTSQATKHMGVTGASEIASTYDLGTLNMETYTRLTKMDFESKWFLEATNTAFEANLHNFGHNGPFNPIFTINDGDGLGPLELYAMNGAISDSETNTKTRAFLKDHATEVRKSCQACVMVDKNSNEFKSNVENAGNDGNAITEIIKQYFIATISIIAATDLAALVIAQFDPVLTPYQVKINGIENMDEAGKSTLEFFINPLLTLALSVVFSLLDEGSDLADLAGYEGMELPLFVISKVGSSLLEFFSGIGFEVGDYTQESWAWVVETAKTVMAIILIGTVMLSGWGAIGSLIVSMILSQALSIILIQM